MILHPITAEFDNRADATRFANKHIAQGWIVNELKDIRSQTEIFPGAKEVWRVKVFPTPIAERARKRA